MMRPLALAALLALPAALNAQWSVGLSIGVARHFGGAVSTADTTPGSVHPYRPTIVGLTVGHDWGPVRGDLGLSYGSPGLAVEIPGGVFIDTKAVRFYSASPEMTVRLIGVGDGGALRLGGGGDFIAWAITDGDTRLRVGGHVTAVYEWPVAGRFLGDLQAGVSLAPSLFDAGDVSPPFERRMLLRPSVSIGLRYR
ncbi:MAG TPA: hypothetical protein VJN62_06680 [Gemmatimonadales bacterium]|nr:hypothetical protein [Gemmatimonadales bacterium]